MNSQSNVYVNPLEHAYGATDHQTRWNRTYYMPIKGRRTPLRIVRLLRTTSLLLYTKGHATYTLTRT